MTSAIVIGGGLAGLASTVALAQRGIRVTLLEARQRLGGRASSFNDVATGQLIDACQHVSMGCCTNLAHFASAVGIDRYLEPQPTLFFMTPDRRVSRFEASRLPAPLHLAGAFLRAHYLSATEKLRIGWGLARLKSMPADVDTPFLPWLESHRQTPNTIQRFWGLVLVSALNETVDRVGTKYARKVFVDGFMTHRRGFEVQVPSVPLARLYGDELESWLNDRQVVVRPGCRVKEFLIREGRMAAVRTRDGEELQADWFVSALPFDQLLDALPREVAEGSETFAGLKNLQISPITSVHLWFDQAITDLPHVVLIDCLGQWLFNRGEGRPGEHYVQVVVSAARSLRGQGNEAIQSAIVDEISQLFPGPARLLRGRVVTEHAATFSAVPGVDRWRPDAASPIANLALAGDWTNTGWPATMEGAVRSGYSAAEAVLRGIGRPETLIQPELG